MTFYYKTKDGVKASISPIEGLEKISKLRYRLTQDPSYIPIYDSTIEFQEEWNEFEQLLKEQPLNNPTKEELEQFWTDTEDAYQPATLTDNTPKNLQPDLFGHSSWESLHQDHNLNQVERYRVLCEKLGLTPKDDLTLKDICDYLELIK